MKKLIKQHSIMNNPGNESFLDVLAKGAEWLNKVIKGPSDSFIEQYVSPEVIHSLKSGEKIKDRIVFVILKKSVYKIGIGDTILGFPVIPLIAENNLCVVIVDDNRIIGLLKRSYPELLIVGNNNDGICELLSSPLYPNYSGQVRNILSLSFYDLVFLRMAYIHVFPWPPRHLIPDVQRVEVWRERLQSLGKGLKIGIAWRKVPMREIWRLQSTELGQWGKLFSIQGVHWLNLQYGARPDELNEVKDNFGVTVHDWPDPADSLKDFESFAAQIACLDLIIAIDNNVVHFAGALGVPVWTLLPFEHIWDWIWTPGFEDTCFYDSMRIFRQGSHGNWDEVFTRVSLELKRFVDTGIMPKIDPAKSYKRAFKLLEGMQKK